MKTIKHFFFDLDHTLWDYDRASTETLLEIYEHFDLKNSEATEVQFLETFDKVNSKLWHQYNSRQIDRGYIKNHRFKKIFNQIGINASFATEASHFFITHCSLKPYLMPDTLIALDYLKKNYKLHIITNGFKDSQGVKLQSSGLDKYFDVVVTSECADSRKPAPEIYQYALNEAKASKSESIMVGDNASTDISGASKFGMCSVFYDPSGKKKAVADYIIQSHLEMIDLF